jgi:putative salt-induced outer membrane protein YdiY
MLAVVALLAAVAQAEDSVFAGTVPDDPPPTTETHLSAELGGTYVTGNTAFYALNALAKADHLWSRNKMSGHLGGTFGGSKSDDDGDGFLSETEREQPLEEDARRVFGEVRYDRYLSDIDSVYALVGAFHDPWLGYDLRSHEQIGYSHLFINTEPTKFRAEIGADIAQENAVDGVEPQYTDIFAGRVLLGLTHAFNESVGFSETFEVYENILDFEDVRMLNTVSFTSNLNKTLSLKLSNILIYDNVPLEGFAKLDTTSMVTFVATIL